MSPSEIEELNDLFQDVIQGLSSDLETGSHHWNNLAHAEFHKKYPRFGEAFNKLGKYINTLHERNG